MPAAQADLCSTRNNSFGNPLFLVHPDGNVLRNLLFEMELNLIVESLGGPLPTQKTLQPEPQSLNPQHDIAP
jgi:hypothetical protein